MATSIWYGAGGTGGRPRSGEFEVGANWANETTPAKDDNVVFADGKYTVDLSQQGYEIGSLTVGTGVTFRSSAKDSVVGYVLTTQDSTNNGAIALNSGEIVVGSGILFNFGEIVGYSQYYLATVAGGGSVLNYDVVHAAPGSVMVFDSYLENKVGGVIDTKGGGNFVIRGSLYNQGLVSARDGGVVNFSYGSAHGTTDNLSGGMLTGGQWSAIGAYSTLQLRDADGLDTIAAGTDVTLSGQGSTISVDDTAGSVTSLDDSLTHIQDGAALHILNGRDYYTTQDLDVDGLLQLGGGTLSSGGLTVHDDATSALVGYGVVNSDIDMYGVLRAARNHDGTSLALTGQNLIYGSGALVGRGVLEIAGGVDTLQDGAQVLVKSLLISGGEIDLQEDLVFGNKLAVRGGGAIDLGGHILRLTGQVDLAASAIADGKLQLEGGDITLHGGQAQITAELRNNGVVDVNGGRFLQLGQVNGVGAFHVGGGAVAEFAGSVGSGQTVSLDGAGAALALENAAAFRGAVDGFGPGETIDLLSFAPTGAALGWKSDAGGAGGDLTVTSGGQSASIHLDGDYRRSQFHLADDGHGGTAVTYGDSAAAMHGDAGWDMHGALAI